MLKKLFFISLILIVFVSFSFGQKASLTKQEVIQELTTNTIDIIPVSKYENMLTPIFEELTPIMEKNISNGIIEKISKNKSLSDEQKTALKPKVDEFSKGVAKNIQDIIIKDFDIRTASNNSMQNNYEKLFTLAELKKLNSLFKTATGKRLVKRFTEMTNDYMNGNKPKITNADLKMFEQMSKFITTNLFKKFTGVFIKNTMADINVYIKTWVDKSRENLDKNLDELKLKEQVEQFIAENSK